MWPPIASLTSRIISSWPASRIAIIEIAEHVAPLADRLRIRRLIRRTFRQAANSFAPFSRNHARNDKISDLRDNDQIGSHSSPGQMLWYILEVCGNRLKRITATRENASDKADICLLNRKNCQKARDFPKIGFMEESAAVRRGHLAPYPTLADRTLPATAARQVR